MKRGQSKGEGLTKSRPTTFTPRKTVGTSPATGNKKGRGNPIIKMK
jgi:hypothetical protein